MAIYKTKTTDYYYEKHGHGKALIFAHGLFIDHSIFDFQIEKLKENYTCYSFDLPGHGLSTYDPNGWTLDDIVEDFKQFIEENHIKQPTLVGLSQGGMIFMRLAAKYPNLIGSLVLVGSSHHPEFLERIPLWNKRIDILKEGDKEQIDIMMKDIQKSIVDQSFIRNYPILKEKELSIMQSNNHEAIILATKAAVIYRKDISADLDKIICPTLIICGTEDHATPLEIARQMQVKIKNSYLKLISNAGHHVPIEAKEEFTDKLIQFLDKE